MSCKEALIIAAVRDNVSLLLSCCCKILTFL